jgi:diguanylate cyclase (GGDEF)-like protein/PAS domain S-box-containing protein
MKQPLKSPPKIFDHPTLIFVIIIISIFLAEFLVMLLLVSLPPLSIFKEALLDAILLTCMLIPMVFFLVYKPFQSYITEHRKADKALQASEKRFRDIAENAQEWIWEVDSEGKYTFVSPVVEKILGYTPEEMLDKHFYDLFHSEDREELKAAAFEAFNKKQSFREFINRNIHKKGNIVWLSTSGIPVLNPEGKLVGYRGADADISERKRAEDKMEESERRFQDVAANTGDWIWETDNQGKYIYSSPVVEKVIGYKPEEVVGKFFYDFIHPDERDRIKKSVYEVFSQKNKFFNILNNKVHKNGKTVICETSGVPILLINGELCGYRGAVRNITERRLAEEALRASEEKAKAISDASTDAIIVMDGKGCISYFNHAAERIFGYTQEEAIGRKLHSFLVSEKCRDEYHRRLPVFEKTGQCKVIGKTLERQGYNKDGNRFPIELSISSFQIKGEWHSVGTVRNITRRKKMEKQLKEAAITDELTGLLNRRGFYALSEQQCKIADRDNPGLSLIYADLDNLKIINDRFGHKEGDRALIDIANIFKKTFRKSDIIGRTGGDEFAVFLTGISKPTIENISLNHVQDNLKIHNKQSNRGYELSVSMGIAYYDPAYPLTIDELIIQADKLMYEKKSAKKNLS